MSRLPDDAPVLFYDADCGVCNRSVRTILRLERADADRSDGRAGTHGVLLRFAARRGPLGDVLHAERPGLEAVDSLLWREPSGDVLVRSAAVIAIARYLGGAWGVLGAVASVVPRVVRDGAYRVFARNRHVIGRLTGAKHGPEGCVVPTAAQRVRFLDGAGEAGVSTPAP
ncbi:MAG: DUF393 domain-containing protein [Planctomycetota bacterium]